MKGIKKSRNDVTKRKEIYNLNSISPLIQHPLNTLKKVYKWMCSNPIEIFHYKHSIRNSTVFFHNKV